LHGNEQFSEKELGFIRRYYGELLIAKLPIKEIIDKASQISPNLLVLKYNHEV
jgi:hypothetical protein